MLLDRGIPQGSKIALLLMNSLEWLPLYFGILKAGMIAVPLNYRYTAEEILYCTEKADCVALVFGGNFTQRIQDISKQLADNLHLIYVGSNCPSFAHKLQDLICYSSSSSPAISLSEDDDAAIYFSSGTTGFPKAVLHKHRSLAHSAIVEVKHHNQTHDDIFLCIPPLYHTGAKMHWFGSLVVGGKAIILKSASAESILTTLSDEQCSIAWMLVPWVQDVLDYIDNNKECLSELDLHSMRLMHMGAQPIPPSLVKRWLSIFPTHEYDTNYGLSEAIGPGCVHLGIENLDKIGSIGKAGYGWLTKIVDENGAAVASGKVGELCVQGPGVMSCYYNDVKATKESFLDGWLMTGDMAFEDSDGFIYLVDRKKDVIITGGENIYPVQIENFLRKIPQIKDVAVIGYPDQRLGEIVAAIIEIKPGTNLTKDMIDEHCLLLPRYKRPRIIFFDNVERNPTGKIDKKKMRAKYCGNSTL